METIFTLVIIGVLLALTFAANLALRERERNLHYLVVVAFALINGILFLLGVLYILIGLSPEILETMLETDIDAGYAILAGVLFILTAVTASLLLIDRLRLRIAGWFPRLRQPELFVPAPSRFDGLMLASDGSIMTMPSTLPEPPRQKVYRGELLGFDPKSTVHMLAMVMCVYLIGSQMANFALSGGLEGVAEGSGVTWGNLILNFIPLVLIPLVGVGLLVRRSWRDILDRLGFHRLTLESIGAGVGVAVAAYVFQFVMVIIWLILVPENVFEDQTEASRAIGESINTIWLVLAVSFTAAVGEEIAFRGALQPIFGFWWTAILFTLTHIQYTLTPATLIIFGVALALGWLRRRYNLYAAIIAHFLYNFIQLVLGLLLN